MISNGQKVCIIATMILSLVIIAGHVIEEFSVRNEIWYLNMTLIAAWAICNAIDNKG